MRIIPFIISTALTGGLVYLLNNPIGESIPMPLGKFLSPQHGFWQNAEPADADYSTDLALPDIEGKAEVYLDERLVPHIFADNERDAYFAQGYLHARFRLFQMDLQTLAAEGRASEIAGEKAVRFDREQRRLGMKYAAENALQAIGTSDTKFAFDAYTAGVNAYISSLTESQLPLEYKILNFKPEKWTNYRTALLLKMMAKMLSSGTESDLAHTNAKTVFSDAELKALYPQVNDSLMPIVPDGTPFATPGIVPVKPAIADSLYLDNKQAVNITEVSRPDKNNGSNNWVVSGSRTESGAPILCNDPHLELSLPSIWYELQVVTPKSNAYGVSLPGSPFVIIGFNDSLAWGVTNAQRDVKDYFEIKFKDNTKKEYWFNGQWTPATLKPEEVKIKGGKVVYDTVAYTVFGPVMYDENFTDDLTGNRNLAVRWTAHDPSNEGSTFYYLNQAKNYDDYLAAIKNFQCPGQNFVFASKSGDIAIWQQGKFPARWDRQGIYVMPGTDSSFMWQGFIPQEENPHSKNPALGYLFSANQRPVDSTYPYFIPGSYITPRGVTIAKQLASMDKVTVKDMMSLQSNYHNSLAATLVPTLLKYIRENDLNSEEKRFLEMIKAWDLRGDPESKGQTVFQCWYDSLEQEIWRDDIGQTKPMTPLPDEQVTIEWLVKDSAMKYVDNRNTPVVETLPDVITLSLKKTIPNLQKAEAENRLNWSAFKNPTVYHLLKESLLPFARKGLHVGGSGYIVNAMTQSHGPSWRMIIDLSGKTTGYGVYPGGQNGNPGSRFYDNFVDTWVEGKYNSLWFMHEADRTSDMIKWKITFSKS